MRYFILRLLLFILFLNDMKLCVTGSVIRFFADDTRILSLKHIYTEQDVIVLQQDLDHVIDWAKRNNIVLHEDKFELLVHRGNPNESLYELPFVCQTQTSKVSGGNMLYPTDQVKDLGVIVSSDMSWSHHVSSMQWHLELEKLQPGCSVRSNAEIESQC